MLIEKIVHFRRKREIKRLEEDLSILTLLVEDIEESEGFSSMFFWRLKDLGCKYPTLIEEIKEDLGHLNKLIAVYDKLERKEKYTLAIKRIKSLIDKIEKEVIKYKLKDDKEKNLKDFKKEEDSRVLLEDTLKRTEYLV